MTDPSPPFERRQRERRKEERERIWQFEQRIAAEQDERRRLALELHDGAVQSLAGIALIALAIGAGALWLGEKAGMSVTSNEHANDLQIVQMAGDDMAEPEETPMAPHDMNGG